MSEECKDNLKVFIQNSDAGLDFDTVLEKVESNCLFQSQLESLIVAFELVWKLAIIKFVENLGAFIHSEEKNIKKEELQSYKKSIEEIFNQLEEIKNNETGQIHYKILNLIEKKKNNFEKTKYEKSLIAKSKKEVEESKSIFLQIPTELYILFYIFEVALLILVANRLISTSTLLGYDISKTIANFYVLAVYIPTIMLIEIFASKYSNDTLTPASIKALKESAEDVNNTINPRTLFFGTLVPILAFILISIYLIYLFIDSNNNALLVIAFFIFISTLSFSIYILYLFHAFNEAINVETRSNEMRSTLITNVTHDIKTPLTSILNYAEIITDEIKNPHEDSKENLIEYSKVLINKSRRLNELINDLIFDSKISSGNIELDMQKIDLDAFLNQCIAEFSDRLDEKGLKVLYECTTKNPFISADSSHLYRVFQNLFSNIYKYALENSRVYIDLKSRKSKTTITIKNIQKEKLEVNIDTLKNRFVRGSKSRSTEGFGLGLSITDNLIKSMGGTFEIKSVKDQFTTVITFLQYEV